MKQEKSRSKSTTINKEKWRNCHDQRNFLSNRKSNSIKFKLFITSLGIVVRAVSKSSFIYLFVSIAPNLIVHISIIISILVYWNICWHYCITRFDIFVFQLRPLSRKPLAMLKAKLMEHEHTKPPCFLLKYFLFLFK